MKIYLSTWLVEVNQGKVLTKVGQFKRLVSFYLLTDQKIQSSHLKRYSHTGKCNHKIV